VIVEKESFCMGFRQGINKLSIDDVESRFIANHLCPLFVDKYQTARSPLEVKCLDCGLVFDISLFRVQSRKGVGCKLHANNRVGLNGSSHGRWTGFKIIPGSYWNSFKKQAIQAGHTLHFDIEYLYVLFEQQSGKCVLSGQSISFGNGYERSTITVSVDRIDSKLEYIKDNVQLIHKNIQYMKHYLTDNEFIRLCILVAEHNLELNPI
jgi:hypothetical protein